MNILKSFSKFSSIIAHIAGQPYAFIAAFSIIIVWGLCGPMFAYSDTWQLVINTGTTIMTFLMVFLIQNTQNRDGKAIHIKLNELIRAHKGAHNALLDLEESTEKELEEIKRQYEALAKDGRRHLDEGKKDTDTADISKTLTQKP